VADWTAQLRTLIEPCVARSAAVEEVLIGPGVVARVGVVARRVASLPRALVMADEAGFGAAGEPAVAALGEAGFQVATLVKPIDPLPVASVEEAEPFRAALAADAGLLPVAVGSGVINDLVKFAAFATDRRYLAVATAASMDGYTSAGAPLAQGGFKVTIPTRAPVAMVADLDVIAAAPAEMNGWGYADLAGKVPAGGDWILADLVGAEPIDAAAWHLVQDHLGGWLDRPEGIARGEREAIARLFIGLTAVGFAMEAHGTSRPASGADHQIAHLWEMAGHSHLGRKVAHGAAVAVGAVATLALFDWLLEQDPTALDVAAIVGNAPDLAAREAVLARTIADPRIAERACCELRAKHVGPAVQAERLGRIVDGWAATRDRLRSHLVRRDAMVAMLHQAGAPAYAAEIGITLDQLTDTMRAAAFIRRRYTIFDFLHETGLFEAALAAVGPRLVASHSPEASA